MSLLLAKLLIATVLRCNDREEMVEVAKAGQVVPESVLKKQKRSEEWALAKKQESELLKKKKDADRKLIFHRVRLQPTSLTL
ncbi:hypothetical protein L6452_06833 [Arctium lappa]|uniref:Uncharacterized protein n=1 Tax=Arctium lappa TaxID=4217 RepID=A0ACB9EKS2_ARCLA|nr:hypothetical protein L6452_06833 [Arctium lappa]